MRSYILINLITRFGLKEFKTKCGQKFVKKTNGISIRPHLLKSFVALVRLLYLKSARRSHTISKFRRKKLWQRILENKTIGMIVVHPIAETTADKLEMREDLNTVLQSKLMSNQKQKDNGGKIRCFQIIRSKSKTSI